MKKLFFRLKESLLFAIDWYRLFRDRRLAEGGIWTIIRVAILCLFSTLVVALILCNIYGTICLNQLKEYLDYADGSFHPDNVFDAAYYLLFTNGGQNLFDENGSHLLSALLTTTGIVLIAFLTSALTSRSERKAQRYIDGESYYRMRKHIIIIGSSDYIYSIIAEKSGDNNNAKKKRRVRQKYLIVTSQNVSAVRREVLSFLDNQTHKNDFVFLFGDRTSQTDLSRLSLERAKEVYIIGDSKETDDIESYRDSNNMDCVVEIGKYLHDSPLIPDKEINTETVNKDGLTAKFERIETNKRHKPLKCHVMFEYQTTFAAFQFCDIPDDLKYYITFMPFNYYDLWARKVIVAGHAGSDIKYKFLDTIKEPVNEEDPGKFITERSNQTVHLIILGMTKMGIAMALQAAHVCHYPNFKSRNNIDSANKKRTRITFIDSNADIEKDYFKGRFSCMMAETRTRLMDFIGTNDYESWNKNENHKWEGDPKGWYDIEWEFIKGRIESDEIQDYLEKSAGNKDHIVSIAVCLPKSHQSIAAAMYMRESVYSNCLQVLVYQRRSGTIVKHLSGSEANQNQVLRYNRIIPFGMMDSGYDSSLDNDNRAMLISYIYDSCYAYNDEFEIKEENIKGKFGRIKKVKRIAPKTYKEGCDIDFKRFFEIDFRADSPDEKTKDGNQVLFRVYPSRKNHPGYEMKWHEKFVMDKMSSAFNANSIDTKLRGIGFNNKNSVNSFTKKQLDTLARVEHNRWNIEKMLTGFRTLTAKEMNDMNLLWKSFNSSKKNKIKQDKDEALWKKKRSQLKDWPSRAHLDICSIEELKNREKESTIKMDDNLSNAIPYIIEIEKKL